MLIFQIFRAFSIVNIPCQYVVIHPSVFFASPYQQKAPSDFIKKVSVFDIIFCSLDKGNNKILSFHLVSFETIVLLKIQFCLIHSHLWRENFRTSVEHTPNNSFHHWSLRNLRSIMRKHFRP